MNFSFCFVCIVSRGNRNGLIHGPLSFSHNVLFWFCLRIRGARRQSFSLVWRKICFVHFLRYKDDLLRPLCLLLAGGKLVRAEKICLIEFLIAGMMILWHFWNTRCSSVLPQFKCRSGRRWDNVTGWWGWGGMRVPELCLCSQFSSCQRLLLRSEIIIFNQQIVSQAWFYDFCTEFVWIYWGNRFIWFEIFFNSAVSDFCVLWQVIFYSNSSSTLEPNSTFNMISFTPLLWTRY